MAYREKRGEDENTRTEYLENEKSFLDEIKNIFNSFWRAVIWLKIKNWWKIADTSFKNVLVYLKNQQVKVWISLSSHADMQIIITHTAALVYLFRLWRGIDGDRHLTTKQLVIDLYGTNIKINTVKTFAEFWMEKNLIQWDK